jgi:nitroreductase
MDTIEVILSRRSVRRYLDAPIAKGDLATMVECARQAPSAGNRQSCHLVVVTDPPLRERVAAACQHQDQTPALDRLAAEGGRVHPLLGKCSVGGA